MRTLVLNNNNVVQNGQNNTLTYRFPTTAKFDRSYVAVASVSMYYSWFNISSAAGNNILQYTWTVGGVATTFNVGTGGTPGGPIPDGLYEVSTLNQLLQYTMIQNKHYLIDQATGQNVYFAELLVNDARYKVQVNTFAVPTSKPSGYDEPSSFAGYPTVVTSPAIFIPSGMGTILGFTGGKNILSNIGGTNFQAYSDLTGGTPNIQPNSSVLVSVSSVDNPYASPTSVIYSVTPSVAVGTIIADKPPQLLWNKLIPGSYSQLTITLLGTDLRPLQIQDGAMTIILAIAEEVEALGVMTDRK
jgi:hypothetical protein